MQQQQQLPQLHGTAVIGSPPAPPPPTPSPNDSLGNLTWGAGPGHVPDAWAGARTTETLEVTVAVTTPGHVPYAVAATRTAQTPATTAARITQMLETTSPVSFASGPPGSQEHLSAPNRLFSKMNHRNTNKFVFLDFGRSSLRSRWRWAAFCVHRHTLAD